MNPLKTNRKSLLISVLLFSFLYAPVNAQNLEHLKDFFTFYPNKKAVEKDSTRYLQKFIAAPVVSFSPETNFAFGTGAKFLFKFTGSGEETRVSNMPMTIQYTLNNQFFVFSGFEIFTNQEKWVIEGNLLLQNYPRLFYGFGRNTEEDAEEVYENNQFLFEPIFLKQTPIRYLFFGAGVRYNRISKTGFEEDGLIDQLRPDGFDGSTSVGAEVALLYDSRNNVLNAQRGWYLEFTHGKYDKVLGGTNIFNLTRFDLRYFKELKNKSKDILAFQFVGRATRGNIPFSEFAFFGSSEIMRGYREGRFVDRDLLASQIEYRKHFGESKFGAVAFLGTGSVYNNLADFQFGSLKPNYGAGLRFKLDKEENLNIRFDWGVGRGTNEFYLSIAEAF